MGLLGQPGLCQNGELLELLVSLRHGDGCVRSRRRLRRQVDLPAGEGLLDPQHHVIAVCVQVGHLNGGDSTAWKGGKSGRESRVDEPIIPTDLLRTSMESHSSISEGTEQEVAFKESMQMLRPSQWGW